MLDVIGPARLRSLLDGIHAPLVVNNE